VRVLIWEGRDLRYQSAYSVYFLGYVYKYIWLRERREFGVRIGMFGNRGTIDVLWVSKFSLGLCFHDKCARCVHLSWINYDGSSGGGHGYDCEFPGRDYSDCRDGLLPRLCQIISRRLRLLQVSSSTHVHLRFALNDFQNCRCAGCLYFGAFSSILDTCDHNPYSIDNLYFRIAHVNYRCDLQHDGNPSFHFLHYRSHKSPPSQLIPPQ
jgi:hypothetical protein